MQGLKITTEDVRAELQRRRRNKINWVFNTPENRAEYSKHMEVIKATSHHRQVCMMAANRVGKSELNAYIVTSHATGIYPDWWDGKRFPKSVNIIVAGETGQLVRDSMQEKLVGPVTDIGTGMIPFDKIVSKTPRSGIPNAFDTVQVKHVSGGISTITFKSYDQGREKFQATAQHVISLDEEPPLEIYTECLLRTMTTKGLVLSTFTPLKGVSQTVLQLQKQAAEGNATVITATWDDCGHLTEDDKEDLMRSLPPHQRDARSKGVPALGSGAIYPVVEEDIICEPFVIPLHWPRAYGMDVGWNNTAALWGAWNRETDVVYLYDEYKRGQCEPVVHAASISGKGDWIPGVIDPASAGANQHDGTNLISKYIGLGLNLEHADNSVEAGIFEFYQRLSTGRLKVFSTLHKFREEYRLYRRDEKGKIVKENDHLMDTGRYLIMSGLQLAKTNTETRVSENAPPMNPFAY